MHTGILILNICFLVVLVATNPISHRVLLQAYPEAHCDEIGYRKTLTDTERYENRNENTIPCILKPNQIATTYQTSQDKLPNNILKLVYNKILSNRVTIDTTKDVKQNSNADVLHHGQISSYIPNVVNNYTILPADTLYNDRNPIKEDEYSEYTFINPKFFTRVKKNVNENIIGTSGSDTGTHFTIKEKIHIDKKKSRNVHENSDKQKEYLKTPLKTFSQKKNNSMQAQILEEKNINLNDISVNENKAQELFKKENSLKLKNKVDKKTTRKQVRESISSNAFETSKEHSDKKQLNNNKKKNSDSKNLGPVSKKYHKKSYDQPKKMKSNEIINKNQLKDEYPEHYKRKEIDVRNRKTKKIKNNNGFKNFPFGPSFQMHYMPYDDDTYNYMNAILSNYKIPHTQFGKDSPFNYNNIYKFTQPSFPWGNIKTRKNKSKLYRRKKQRNDYRKKLNKKKMFTRKKQREKNVFTSAIVENENIGVTTPIIPLKSLITARLDTEEKINENSKLSENSSIKEKIFSAEESDFTMNLVNMSIHNNTLIDKSLNYNSHPSFIIGMEDNIPIIFENGVIDDYYPDFTADNELLSNKGVLPSKYHGDKYHYVSNQYIDFEDYVKTRKRLAMKNMNISSNFFYSDNGVNREVEPNSTVSTEEKEVKSFIQFQSPPFLDNPDFRTRKINSNEVYEPYYNHNTFEDPDEDFNEYYKDDKSLVYSTSASSKNNMKTKLFNDIDDHTKSKWKRMKNPNVETVHSRSKLAKYGIMF